VTTEESLLLLPPLGLQLERRTLGVCHGRRFVPLDCVLAVVVNEAVTTTSVSFYLALAVRGEAELLLPFAGLRPRLASLLPAYRATLALLPADLPEWPS
jgi:phosphatidylinositol glycan class H protein